MRFSLIIPCFNCEEFIGETIESIINQGFDDYECIFVDDGSSDSSLEVLKQSKRLFNNNIKIISQKNSGVSNARNRGLSLANGEYVIFIDSDDMIAPGYLRTIEQCIRNHGEVDVVCSYRTNNINEIKAIKFNEYCSSVSPIELLRQ